MINVEDKSKCCGCTACSNICPQKCITMVPDEEGFLYPVVNSEKCVRCGQCLNVCPEINGTCLSEIKQGFIIRNKRKDVLMNSTSGGFYSIICEYFQNNNSHIYGVVIDNANVVKHAEYPGECKDTSAFKGSKYVQSHLGECFSRIKHQLNNNETVLFSGTACQIAGLKNYLKKPYDNLTTVEVVCHGTPSPMLWEKYIQLLEQCYNSKIVSSNFRNKRNGYHSGVMSHTFNSGRCYYRSGRTDIFLKSFFSEIASRPCCYSCSYKGKKRVADFTIFDSWHAADLDGSIVDDDKGFTNVFINSDSAQLIFDSITSQMDVWEVDVDRAIVLDGIMIMKQPIAHSRRKDFYVSINNVGLEKTIETFLPIRNKDYMVEFLKFALSRMGLVYKLKKILKNKRRDKQK